MFIDLMEPKKKNDLMADDPTKTGVYIETYGCQMNVADSEIVASIMADNGYFVTNDIDRSNVIFLNTCSIRDNAEQKIFNRLNHLRGLQKKRNNKLVVGILGCMAERLKGKLIGERDLVSIVVGPDEYRAIPELVDNALSGVGPDEYRAIPELVDNALSGEQGIAVKLSKVETYDDIAPLRTEGISAWLSIMRGCNNFCAFCVVPYTRGRERSRTLRGVVDEVKQLWDNGTKEVTLLGQNVNSYNDKMGGYKFPELLAECAKAVPEMRFRYTTSHPHDMSDELIEAHATYDNICNYIHLPVQSGSSRVLKKMRRDYDIPKYMERMHKIKELVPNVALSTDIISGFCTETEEDHQMTLDLMAEVRYDGAYMFKYSERPNTLAEKYEDDVPEEVKTRRLSEIIEQQNQISKEINEGEIGKTHEILMEGPSKKSDAQWQGRTDTNKVCIVDFQDDFVVGEKYKVKVNRSNSATLFGEIVK